MGGSSSTIVQERERGNSPLLPGSDLDSDALCVCKCQSDTPRKMEPAQSKSTLEAWQARGGRWRRTHDQADNGEDEPASQAHVPLQRQEFPSACHRSPAQPSFTPAAQAMKPNTCCAQDVRDSQLSDCASSMSIDEQMGELKTVQHVELLVI